KRRKAAGEDVIDLGAGEPDFPTPPIAADAGVRAIREGKTHYPANEGILELRAAAATQLSLLSGGRPVNADHIVISNGSKQSLFNVCFSVFGPGDVVAIPAPAWVSYPQIVHLTRARPILVPGDPEWGHKLSVRDLQRVVPGAQGLILCSPCNPTGSVYTLAELKAIAQWARDHKAWVIADEIYRRIHYGPVPPGPPGRRVRGPTGRVLLLFPRGFVRGLERHGVLHAADHVHRRRTRPGRGVRG